MPRMQKHESLETKLDAFASAERRAALRDLVLTSEQGRSVSSNVNMHFHSFFSFNAKGWSPSRIAWEARKAGLYAAALCDFDVLDGLDEFWDACLMVGLRASVHVETRAYLKEFSQAEINSPGEPGVTYIMGGGFARTPPAGSREAHVLSQLREQASQRNRALVLRLNPHMGRASVDYENDVVPLSPGRCPTERHIVRAYIAKSRSVFTVQEDLVTFWAGLFGKGTEDARKVLENAPILEERVRGKLVKQGGLGYEPPTIKTFPAVDDFVAWVSACDAIPMAAWLDGTSKGESDPIALLDCLQAKGVAAVNIIPDRNWNYADPAVRALKTRKLKEFVDAAESLHLPVNIGTEMNRDGLPFVDDLNGEDLKPYQGLFVQGAQVMVGHSILARYARFSYVSRMADNEFASDRRARNRFFASVGMLPPLTRPVADRLSSMGETKALEAIRRAADKGKW